jgi:outer membrane protein assembly factor BamB
MFRGNAAHTGVYDADGPVNLGGVLWRFPTMGPVRSSPVAAGDVVYVGSTDGNLYALDRTTGAERWRVDVKSPVSSSPAVTRGLVIFGSRDGAFHAVDAASGAFRWRFDTGPLVPWEWGFEGWDVYTSSPVVVDSVVVFGAGDGVLYALDVATGGELWRFTTEGRIRSSPAATDGTIFVGSTDGRVYAVDLETGRERWRHEISGPSVRSADLGVDRKSIIASAAVAGGTVYIGSRDGYMYALDKDSGERRWRVNHEGSWAMSSPAVLENILYSGTSDGRWVHALDADSGEELWRFVGAGYTWSSPCLAGDVLYVGDGGGYLRALDRHTGTELWSYRVGDGVYSSPVVGDGVVLFGSDDGTVYALHGVGRQAHRAVFWDENLRDYTIFRSHLETRVYLEQRGYQVLNADGLGGFMEDRSRDGHPSVLVFAMDHLPASVATESSDTVLFRRYLESGGKVVWLGLPPMLLTRDETGRAIALDRTGATRLLGVDYGGVNFDFYASAPTDLGRRWGLERGWVSSYALDASDVIEVLGVDENGRAGAWVKGFGGPPGAGFVSLGSDHVTWEGLRAIYAVAEYGIGETTAGR